MWTTPKTNWQPGESFSLVPDYARIRGNILHLHQMAAPLHLPFALTAMGEFTAADIPTTAFFAAVDNNTDTLRQGTFFPPGAPHARTYKPNGPVWSAADLNRIESAQLTLYRDLQAEAAAQKTLQFTMGGGIFAAFI